MANSKSNGPTYEYATVDTAPGASGYWSDPVFPKKESIDKLYFSIRETGDSSSFTATVTLQFKCPGDTEWTVYNTYTAVTREIIEDSGRVQWRAGVDNGDYTDGTVTVGLDW